MGMSEREARNERLLRYASMGDMLRHLENNQPTVRREGWYLLVHRLPSASLYRPGEDVEDIDGLVLAVALFSRRLFQDVTRL